MSRLARALHRLVSELDRLDVRWALLGGLAVSARTEPRFTRDVDVAVSVGADVEAEALIRELTARSYRVLAAIEQTAISRLATVRLQSPDEDVEGVVVDLLFASSGIEPEIVQAAQPLEILPDLTCPVARVGHLLALKILARDDETRPQDAADIRALIQVSDPVDVQMARDAVAQIGARGYARQRDLGPLLEKALGVP